MQLGAMNQPRRDLFKEIDWIGQNGFDFIDLALEAPGAALERTDWRAVKSALQDRGLGVVCHAARYLPIDSPSPIVRQAAVDELRRSIDAAQILGAALCTVAFRGWPDYLTEVEGYEYYRQLFTILINHAAERKIEVALENSIRHAHQLKYFREIFFRLPQLKLLYDIGHGNVNTVKSMTRDYLFALSDRLAHVHLSDNNGQEDLNLPFGAASSGGIDLERELRELRNFTYNGTITLQMYGDRRWLLACAQIVREAWGRDDRMTK